MAIDAVFYPYSLNLPAQVSPAIAAASIAVLENPESTFELTEISEKGAGSLGPEFIGSLGERPTVTAETSQIGPILERVAGGYGVIHCMTATGQQLDMNYRKGSQCGARVSLASGEHLVMRYDESAILTLEDLSVRQNELARTRFKVRGVTDGTNPPAVPITNQTLTAVAAATGFYTLGPMAIGGAAVPGCREWSLAPGITEESLSGDGSVYSDYEGVASIEPVVTAMFVNANLFATYKGAGAIIPAGGVELYLRSAVPTSDGIHLVPKATASHIKISFDFGKIRARKLSGGRTDVELQIPMSRDAANDRWFLIQTGVAIPY